MTSSSSTHAPAQRTTKVVALKDAIDALKEQAVAAIDDAHNLPAVLEAIAEVRERVEAGEVADADKKRLVLRYLRLAEESL